MNAKTYTYNTYRKNVSVIPTEMMWFKCLIWLNAIDLIGIMYI